MYGVVVGLFGTASLFHPYNTVAQLHLGFINLYATPIALQNIQYNYVFVRSLTHSPCLYPHYRLDFRGLGSHRDCGLVACGSRDLWEVAGGTRGNFRGCSSSQEESASERDCIEQGWSYCGCRPSIVVSVSSYDTPYQQYVVCSNRVFEQIQMIPWTEG